MTRTFETTANSLVIILGREELYVLLAYLGLTAPPELEDFESSVIGPLAGARQAALQAVERGLVARQYLLVESGGRPVPHPGVAQAVTTCSRPLRSLIVATRIPGAQARLQYLHFRDGLFVLRAEPIDGLHEFRVFADADAAKLAVAEAVGAVGQATGSPTTFALSAAEFAAMTEQSKAAGDAALPIPPETHGLAEAARDFKSLTILVRIGYTDGASPLLSTGLTILNGRQAVWLAEPMETPDRLWVTTASPALIAGKLSGMIDALAGAEVG